MPNGLWYESGPYRMDERKAASAFSKGDLLTLSSSSLSRLNPYAIAAATQYAIATADSTDSIKDGKCAVLVIQPTTRFWARLQAGDTFVTGTESSLSFVVGTDGRYFVDTTVSSGASCSVICVRGTDDIDQSVQSKCIVQFKFADSELDLS